jgi:acyl-CoA thioesterase-1
MADDKTPGAAEESTPAVITPPMTTPSEGADLIPANGAKVHDPVGEGPRVVFLGTSITAGYGIQPNQAYPAIIQKMAESEGLPIRAVNAGLSGETSAGALRRIDWALKTPFDILVLETGANDALRALPVKDLRSNVTKIIRKIKKSQPTATIVVLEMVAPPNLGPEYIKELAIAYREVAAKEHVKLLPFFLDGVAGVVDMNQLDGVHPTPAGATRVAQNVWKGLKPVVQARIKLGNFAPKN